MGQRARLKSNIKKNGLNALNKMKVWFKDEHLAHWPTLLYFIGLFRRKKYGNGYTINRKAETVIFPLKCMAGT